MADSTDWPSWVQAIAGVAIAVLTLVLWLSTKKYAEAAEKLTEQAARTNDLSEANIARTLALERPVLVLTSLGADSETVAGLWRVTVQVVNGGKTVASDLELHTDWGVFRFNAVVPPGAGGPGGLQLFQEAVKPPDDGGPRPVATYWRFSDPGGTLYQQPIGGRPDILKDS